MKIILEHNKKILKTIELTALQGKALKLMGGSDPVGLLAGKIKRILEFAVNQARQTIDRISPLTNRQMESMIDEIEEEKKDEPES